MAKARAMIKCATQGCKRLVFPGQKQCWLCWLKKRDERLGPLRKGDERWP